LANPEETTMSRQKKAEELGITFTKQDPGYLNLCIRTGNLLMTSGHVSNMKGKLGAGLTVEQGYQAARECAVKILNSVWNTHGSLDGLKVVKLLGCVNSTLEFTDQHLVVNGCSDLLHEIYGKTGDGYHARSAVGFAQLPTGVAVEVEAIFEIL
jgi:enamine deaminase RidA (YjgF/YER057c/UK114 family)